MHIHTLLPIKWMNITISMEENMLQKYKSSTIHIDIDTVIILTQLLQSRLVHSCLLIRSRSLLC
ncbi:hypothetical protein Hdeb2414_s0006g00221371 [Helianthus debilis subsp. tardiflorus]